MNPGIHHARLTAATGVVPLVHRVDQLARSHSVAHNLNGKALRFQVVGKAIDRTHAQRADHGIALKRTLPPS